MSARPGGMTARCRVSGDMTGVKRLKNVTTHDRTNRVGQLLTDEQCSRCGLINPSPLPFRCLFILVLNLILSVDIPLITRDNVPDKSGAL